MWISVPMLLCLLLLWYLFQPRPYEPLEFPHIEIDYGKLRAVTFGCRWGHVEVVDVLPQPGANLPHFRLRCDCGKKITVGNGEGGRYEISRLLNGEIKTCGVVCSIYKEEQRTMRERAKAAEARLLAKAQADVAKARAEYEANHVVNEAAPVPAKQRASL